MKPKLILAMFAGGMTQVFINVLFDSGLRAPAAPGSVIAVYAQTPGDSIVGVTLSIIGGAAASFVVAALLLKTDKTVEAEDELVGATRAMEAMKGKSSIASAALVGGAIASSGPIRNIVFACDAGMGSSAMGASVLRRKVHGAGFTDVTVVNKAIANLTDDFDLVVSHQDLTERAALRSKSAVHVSVENFMDSPAYDEIVELVRQRNGAAAGAAPAPDEQDLGGTLLSADAIVLDAPAESRDAAITRAGELLVAAEAVDSSYVAAMHAREESVSTFMGNGLALPHGTNEAKASIRRTAVSFVRYADPVDWNGKQVRFVIGVAAVGDDHLKLLRRIAEIFVDKEQIARLEAATSPEEVDRNPGRRSLPDGWGRAGGQATAVCSRTCLTVPAPVSSASWRVAPSGAQPAPVRNARDVVVGAVDPAS